MFEVRFYPGAPSVQGVNFEINRFLGREEPRPDRVECNGSTSTQARWIDPGPVRFGFAFKILQPFAERHYRTLDELGADLVRAGIPLIDLRKTAGFVRDGDHFMELLETHSLEQFRDEITFIRRNADGTHDDIWLLREAVFNPLRWYKLIRRATHRTKRQVWIRGAVSLGDLKGFPSEWIRGEFGPPPVPRPSPTPSAPPIVVESVPEKATEQADMRPPPFLSVVEPSPKRRRTPVVDVSPVVAEDDDGNPITELEIMREGNRTVPRNMPRNLIPAAPKGSSDRKWERLMLIEQIRYRRRVAPKKAAG
ncbi:hypothetical protein OIU34_23090 [Pararhizobium sp. BT-229]|uniref:hypothetical protein n=1 Tax=Pararhizobium sp. BT-229 TaxID=2986923 RepID=UPI0021F70E80|nr:hypothetical protein [Pararhizobium sp. BT-229]MCV9964781.1 hypothetical protein [Pararhizobium sp. BT-229]